jgi:hypothetical protein
MRCPLEAGSSGCFDNTECEVHPST